MLKFFFLIFCILTILAPVAQAQDIKTAEQLWNEFSENEIRFEQTYKGKRINLVGEVYKVGTASGGRASVSLKAGVLSGVICYFDGAYKNSLAKLNPGDRLRMSGTYSQKMLTTLFFEDCGQAE